MLKPTLLTLALLACIYLTGCTPEEAKRLRDSGNAIGLTLPAPFNVIVPIGTSFAAGLSEILRRKEKKDHLSTIAGVAGLIEKKALELNEANKAILKKAQTPGARKRVDQFDTKNSGA